VVGETTAGGAHPTKLEPIDDHFAVAVPFARSRSPITRTNWQGTGVEPDRKVPAGQALDVALKMAIEEVGKDRQ
jgi:C-terminal processing protease CtpA/Prc